MYDELKTALQTALASANVPLAEYAWDTRPEGNFAVIALDGAAGTLGANGHIENQAPEGTVDLFLTDGDRTIPHVIQSVLNQTDGCAWRLESLQYEPDARLLHWEWVFQLERW